MKKNMDASRGIILPALRKCCDKLASAFKKGALFSLATGYNKSEKAFEDSTIRKAISSTTSDNKGVVRRFKRMISRQFENSLLINTTSLLARWLLAMPLKIYGMFFASFGIYTAAVCLLKAYALLAKDAAVRDLMVGIIVVSVSVPMLFSSRCLAEALGASRVLRPILINVFGVSAVSLEKEAVDVRYHSISVVAGLAFGTLTYFFDPLYILVGFLTVILLWLLMSFPEAGVVIAFASVPFMGFVEHPSLTLAILVMLTAFSYGIKLLRGKRVVAFEIVDLFVFLFWLVTLLSGITPSGRAGANEALLSAGLMLIYFLASNLIRSRNWLNITLALSIASATVTSFLGLAQSLLGYAKLDWIDETFFSGITGRVTSVFENPNVLSAYLVIVIPATIAVCFYHKDRSVRVLCAICAAIMLACVIFTWSRGAWIGLCASLILLLLSIGVRNILAVPPVAALVAIGSWAFPNTFGARAGNIFTLADSSNHYRVSIWEGVGNMLRESWACGIGAGEMNFRSVYINFATAGIENAPHAHSLYLQILVQVGVIGIVFLLGAVLLCAQKVYSHRFNALADDETRLIAVGCFAGVVAMLVFGLFDYTWYNYRILFVFWAFLGLAAAAVNVGREDIRLNEAVIPCHETAATESAELTINFRKEES